MTYVSIELKPLHPEMGKSIPVPTRMSAAAAGFDLAAAVDEPIVLQPGERKLIPCGFAVALPEGYEAQIRPRSGLAFKNGITCLNSPGTVDSDYRGEVRVLLINLGQEAFTIERGLRIAQMVIGRVPNVELQVVATLSDTLRGAGGFGSTGV